MAKPRGIQWLEEQTGASIDVQAAQTSDQDRHLSVRVGHELAAALEAIAGERGLILSQLVREILRESVAERNAVATMDSRKLADRLAADVAEVRRRLVAG